MRTVFCWPFMLVMGSLLIGGCVPTPVASPTQQSVPPQLPTATVTPLAPAPTLPSTPTPTPERTPAPVGKATPLTYALLLNPRICGALLTAGDGQLLGKISGNRFDPESIINESGKYGSQTSRTSIWNPSTRYGSNSNSSSAFNDFATSPPQMFQGGKAIGFVTTSSYRAVRVHPLELKGWLSQGNCMAQ